MIRRQSGVAISHSADAMWGRDHKSLSAEQSRDDRYYGFHIPDTLKLNQGTGNRLLLWMIWSERVRSAVRNHRGRLGGQLEEI